MSRSTPWILAFAAWIALGVVVLDWHRRGAQIAQLEKAQRASDEGEHLGKERLHRLEAALAQAREALAASDAAKLKNGNDSAKKGNGLPSDRDEEMRKDPRYVGAWRQGLRRKIQQSYGAAIAAMKLSPDQEAKLRDLLVERVESAADARDAATAQGLSQTGIRVAFFQTSVEVNDEIKGLIGKDGYAALEEGSRASGMTAEVSTGVGIDLAAADAPLTPDQISQLAKVYAVIDPGPVAPQDDPSVLTARNQWVLDHASSFLSPDQLAAMKRSLQNTQAAQQYFNGQEDAHLPGGAH